mmetsp:Transcript_74497/g.164698  ORF Transcript_74497/g.164698 Transcript_74497/m.164698 type:complete len:246 (+) Transcript_74497:2458-3195(+)
MSALSKSNSSESRHNLCVPKEDMASEGPMVLNRGGVSSPLSGTSCLSCASSSAGGFPLPLGKASPASSHWSSALATSELASPLSASASTQLGGVQAPIAVRNACTSSDFSVSPTGPSTPASSKRRFNSRTGRAESSSSDFFGQVVPPPTSAGSSLEAMASRKAITSSDFSFTPAGKATPASARRRFSSRTGNAARSSAAAATFELSCTSMEASSSCGSIASTSSSPSPSRRSSATQAWQLRGDAA